MRRRVFLAQVNNYEELQMKKVFVTFCVGDKVVIITKPLSSPKGQVPIGYISKIVTIYALVDPRNNEIRYVGKTERPLNKRLSGHLCGLNGEYSRVNLWIQELKLQKLEPKITTLEEVRFDEWSETEKKWIFYLKSLGVNLTNGTKGGGGATKSGITEETRKKMSQSWRPRKPMSEEKVKEIGRKISNSKKGVLFSEEHKAKLSIAKRGCRLSAQHKAKISLALKGKVKTPEHLKAIAEANRRNKVK